MPPSPTQALSAVNSLSSFLAGSSLWNKLGDIQLTSIQPRSTPSVIFDHCIPVCEVCFGLVEFYPEAITGNHLVIIIQCFTPFYG